MLSRRAQQVPTTLRYAIHECPSSLPLPILFLHLVFSPLLIHIGNQLESHLFPEAFPGCNTINLRDLPPL